MKTQSHFSIIILLDICTSAFITDASGNTSGNKDYCSTSTTIPRICAAKKLLSGGTLGYPTTYRINVKYQGDYSIAPLGTLEAENIVLTDILPAGATFISADVYSALYSSGSLGSGTESGGVVTINIPDLDFYNVNSSGDWQTRTYYLDITVQFNDPLFSVGSIMTNNVTVAYTPVNSTPSSLNNGDNIGGITDLTETTTLTAPTLSAQLVKSGSGNVFPGNEFSYSIGFKNTGNVPLDNLEIIETVPNNMIIDSIKST